jgi:pyruvate carboxylase
VLAAIEAGCDAVDGAMDAMSGLTSQPNLGSIAAALAGQRTRPGPDRPCRMFEISQYWEGVRRYYAPFEADMRAGTSDVYRHEMPGGQYTNLREQARAWVWSSVGPRYRRPMPMSTAVVRRYRQGHADVQGGGRHGPVHGRQRPDACPRWPIRQGRWPFPESVVSLFKGELGFPPDGFLKARQGIAAPPVALSSW